MAIASTAPEVRFAGRNLNINRDELLKLLEDDDSDTLTLEAPEGFGELPTQAVSEMVKNKGRGSVLGYQVGGKPTRYTTTSDIIRDAVNPGGGGGTTPDEEEELKKYYGVVGGVSVKDIGLGGFGMKDYNAAIDAGYDPDSIKEWVNANRSNLYNIGPDAQKLFGITDYESTAPGVYDYTEFGGEGFGMEDLKDLQSRNVDPDTIRTLAKQASMLGPDAAAQLNLTPSQSQLKTAASKQVASIPATTYQRPSTSSTPKTGYGLGKGDGSGFNYAAFGGGGFGLQDVAALQSRGASQADIKKIAQGAPGGVIGEGARALLGL